MATTKSKKIEDANIDNTNNEKEGEKEMNNGTVIANGINGNGYSNGNGYMLSNMKPVELSMKEFESLTPEKLMEIVVPRLSRIRTKAELVSRIRAGKIKIGQPATLMNWTFKNVVVKDVSNALADVTSTVTSGSSSVSGDVITLPIIKSLTDGHKYRVEVKFTAGGNIWECYFYIDASA